MKVILGNIFLSYGGIETIRFFKASRILFEVEGPMKDTYIILFCVSFTVSFKVISTLNNYFLFLIR